MAAKKKKAPGRSLNETERGTSRMNLRLDVATAAALETLMARWGVKATAAIARAILQAVDGRALG